MRRDALDVERLTMECRCAKPPELEPVRAGVHSREKPHERKTALQAAHPIQGKLDVAHVGPGKRKSCAKLRFGCASAHAPDEDELERYGLLRPNSTHNEKLSTAPLAAVCLCHVRITLPRFSSGSRSWSTQRLRGERVAPQRCSLNAPMRMSLDDAVDTRARGRQAQPTVTRGKSKNAPVAQLDRAAAF